VFEIGRSQISLNWKISVKYFVDHRNQLLQGSRPKNRCRIEVIDHSTVVGCSLVNMSSLVGINIVYVFPVYMQAEMSLTTLIVDGGVWSVMWQRLAQVLRVDSTETYSSLRDVDDEAADVPSHATTVQLPDWSLLSFKGLSTALNIAIAVFIKVRRLSLLSVLLLFPV